jgi:hypothetical protein
MPASRQFLGVRSNGTVGCRCSNSQNVIGRPAPPESGERPRRRRHQDGARPGALPGHQPDGPGSPEEKPGRAQRPFALFLSAGFFAVALFGVALAVVLAAGWAEDFLVGADRATPITVSVPAAGMRLVSSPESHRTVISAPLTAVTVPLRGVWPIFRVAASTASPTLTGLLLLVVYPAPQSVPQRRWPVSRQPTGAHHTSATCHDKRPWATAAAVVAAGLHQSRTIRGWKIGRAVPLGNAVGQATCWPGS